MNEEDLRLVRPHSVFVEHLKHSGFSEKSGLYVFYEDHDKTSMLVRVLDVGPGCTAAVVGKVYLTKVYRDESFERDGIRYRVMDERFLEAEIDGYDEKAKEIQDEQEADGFPVCGKT